MNTLNQNNSVNLNGVGALQGAVADVGATGLQLNTAVPSNTTGQLLSISFTAATLQAIWLVSSQPLTIATNSQSTPGQTINLRAGIPYKWSASTGYFTNPITTNVTAFYLSTTGGPAATLKGYILTP